ncbi:uncharacterized protein LOC143277024 [Babylonia areolata]|uniref:uncharacterized protein LOC143277024 n=1 Tax=Babylonia areolata TaxID=304850 RepID=UPI003FCFE61B
MDFDQFGKAERLEKEGRQDEALLAYSEFIEQQNTCKPTDCNRVQKEKLAMAHNNRGFLYYLKVEFKLAVQDYTQALTFNPHLAVAHYNRGLIHYRLSRFSEAVEDMQKALSLQPDFQPAQQCLHQSVIDLAQKETGQHNNQS